MRSWYFRIRPTSEVLDEIVVHAHLLQKDEYALAKPLVHHLVQVRNILPDESTNRLPTASDERMLEISTQNGVTVAGILK